MAKSKQEGAKVLREGEVKGQVLPPHVFGDVTPEMNISREEIFGPLIGILKARNEAHALELANDTEYGLSSAVFSGDLARGLRFAQRIRAGMVHVNDMPVNDEPNAPFGGEKNSGLGASVVIGPSPSSPQTNGSVFSTNPESIRFKRSPFNRTFYTYLF